MELVVHSAVKAVNLQESNKKIPAVQHIRYFIGTYKEIHSFTVDVCRELNKERIQYVEKLIDVWEKAHNKLVHTMEMELEEGNQKRNQSFSNKLFHSMIFQEAIAYEDKANAPIQAVSLQEKHRDGETVTNSIKSLIKGWIKKRWLGPLLEIIDEIISLLRPL